MEDDLVITGTAAGEVAAVVKATGIRLFTDDQGDFRVKRGQVKSMEAA